MNCQYMSFLLVLMLFAVMAGCGQKEIAGKSGAPAEFLPLEMPAADLTRSSEIRTYVGDSLWEYINGGAEVYHAYGFVDVATADYRLDETDMVIDIYRFKTLDGAFGLYSSIRPPEPKPLPAGVAGFITSTSADFVKGPYLGRITAFEPSEELTATMRSAAEILASQLPGATEMPKPFALFPSANSVSHSEQIYAESFLGRQSLAWVYAQKYSVANDTITLFLITDDAEAKFDRFRLSSEETDVRLQPASNLLLDEGNGFIFDHPYYGTIAIGLKGKYLAGMIGVNDDTMAFLNTWLQSIGNSGKRQ